MKKSVRLLLLLLILPGVGGGYLGYQHRGAANGQILLYGNVDQRLVALAFNDAERIAEMLVEEGETVEAGQIVARQETRRLKDRIAEAEAALAQAEISLLRLRNGSRPEEIAQARASVDEAEAQARYAERQYTRYNQTFQMSKGGAISQLDVEESRANYDAALARLEGQKQALALTLEGPRSEDIAEAEGVLREREAALALLHRQMEDSALKSPVRAVVRNRLLEPGEMAGPDRPAYSLALFSPKWVRAYVSETKLGQVRYGMTASMRTDARPDEAIEGWIGFISPNAEFTPKTVQSPELRTALVYEIRIHVDDPDNRLQLGLPVTVAIDPNQPVAQKERLVPGKAETDE